MSRSLTRPAASLRRTATMLPLPLLGSLLAAVALAGCDSGKSNEPAAATVQRPVLVAPGEYKNIRPARSLAAVIRPRIESDLGFRVNGKIAKRLVQNGDQVRKGQSLLLLDTNDLELQLQQAEAEMKANIVGHETRIRTLREREVGLRTELVEAREALAAARIPLDPPALRLYDRIATNGQPVCVAIHDGKCGGCHLKVSGEADSVARKGDQLATCDQCGRIVWWEA